MDRAVGALTSGTPSRLSVVSASGTITVARVSEVISIVPIMAVLRQYPRKALKYSPTRVLNLFQNS